MPSTAVGEFEPAKFNYRDAPCTEALDAYVRELGGNWEEFFPYFCNAAAEVCWDWKHPFPFTVGERVRLRISGETRRVGTVTDVMFGGRQPWDCGSVRVE